MKEKPEELERMVRSQMLRLVMVKPGIFAAVPVNELPGEYD